MCSNLFGSFIAGFFLSALFIAGLGGLISLFLLSPIMFTIFIGIPIIIGGVCSFISYRCEK